MGKKVLLAMVLAVLFLSTNVWAGGCGGCAKGSMPCEESEKKEKEIEGVTVATPKLKKGELVITGTLICTSCNLKKKGAKSQCSVYGCGYAINIEKAINRKGKSVEEHTGKLYHILATDSSANLLQKKYKGSKVIIVGKVYSDERIVEVKFVKLAPAKKIYTCSMCGGEFDKPGKCQKCGMKLIKKK